MHDEEFPAIGGGMYIAAANAHIAKQRAAELADVFVVVSGHVDDPRAFLGHGKNRAQHLVVRFGPVERPAETPEVHDVADEKQIVDLDRFQELQQLARPAIPRAKMDVGYEYRAEADFLGAIRIVHGSGVCPPSISPL